MFELAYNNTIRKFDCGNSIGAYSSPPSLFKLAFFCNFLFWDNCRFHMQLWKTILQSPKYPIVSRWYHLRWLEGEIPTRKWMWIQLQPSPALSALTHVHLWCVRMHGFASCFKHGELDWLESQQWKRWVGVWGHWEMCSLVAVH
jgi:hypothetical protein